VRVPAGRIKNKQTNKHGGKKAQVPVNQRTRTENVTKFAALKIIFGGI
jgi:hypothetical protein